MITQDLAAEQMSFDTHILIQILSGVSRIEGMLSCSQKSSGGNPGAFSSINTGGTGVGTAEVSYDSDLFTYDGALDITYNGGIL